MTTPEGAVKKAVKKVLDKLGAYYFFPVQMGMGARTLDILVCYRGKFFGFEIKAPGEKPTALQSLCMKKILEAVYNRLLIIILYIIFNISQLSHVPRNND